jgi:hypothetical protein
MLKNKRFLLMFVLAVASIFAFSQNNTNSPYTRYGYGEITESLSGEQRAMGGTGFALRPSNGINSLNPASYSRIDSTTFLFDVGVSGLLSRFSDPLGNRTLFNANIEYLTVQFPLMRNVGFSAGLQPYSFSGYNYYSTSYLPTTEYPDTIFSTQRYYGNGGINQIYGGLSVEVLKHISLGVNAYYMFGSSINSRELSFSDVLVQSSAQKDSITVSSLRLRYGIQLFNTFAKKHEFNLGAIYEFKKKLNATFTEATGSVLTDLTTSEDIYTQFDTPETFGVGFAYTYDKKLTLTADYSMQKWADAKFIGTLDTLSNSSKIAIGAEYQPDKKGRHYYEKVLYRAGFNLSDPYYKINGAIQPKNFGITFGLGLPLKNSNTILNTSFEYGKIGTAGMLREDYFKITINAAFNETWFFKRKL